MIYSVLIIDENKLWVDLLKAFIEREEEFGTVFTAVNGQDGLNLIQNELPDIIILDLIIPEYDGLYIINYISDNIQYYKPIIYIISGMSTNTLMGILKTLDIDYFNIKPIDVKIVIQNIKTIIKKRQNDEITVSLTGIETAARGSASGGEPIGKFAPNVVTPVLYELGLVPGLLSTRYTADIVVLYNQNSAYSTRIFTKILYPEIAKKYNVTQSSVEKNIRNAAANAAKHNTPLYQSLFKYYANGNITNSTFVSVISEYLNNPKPD
jgi:two-component system response regulator (stage 0 sporulation protein A)